MEKGFNGRVAIEEMYEELKQAVCSVMIAREIDHIQAFKNFGVSRVDLHALISGRGNKMPLARLFMFAADLGIKVTIGVELPANKNVKQKPEPRTKVKSEPSQADSDFEDEPVRRTRKKRS